MVWSLTLTYSQTSWNGKSVGCRKYQYEQNQWRWWNCSGAISNPKRLCCGSVAFNMSGNLENSAVATGLKWSPFIPIPKKGNATECYNYHTISFTSHVVNNAQTSPSQVNNVWTVNFQVFLVVLEKAGEPEVKLLTPIGSSKKQESSRKKKIYFALLTMSKPLTVWITINSGKFWKRWEYQTT